MEESISCLSRSLGAFCNHLQSSCDALKQSVDRRPIPLRSASSPFIDSLNRGVSAATGDLNLLDSMSFATVSLEELMGHCRQLFIKNQTHLVELNDLIKAHGYIPQTEDEDHDEEQELSLINMVNGTDAASSFRGSTAAENSVSNNLEEDPLLDESLSLKKFGLSDVCLATLASVGSGSDKQKCMVPLPSLQDDKFNQPGISFRENLNYNKHDIDNVKDQWKHSSGAHGANEGGIQHEQNEPSGPMIGVSKDDYESLPSYVKSLASWEGVLDAVQKINLSLGKKWKTQGCDYLNQEEIESLELGPKRRAFVLLLVKMSRLAVETTDGQISYRVL